MFAYAFKDIGWLIGCGFLDFAALAQFEGLHEVGAGHITDNFIFVLSLRSV